MKRIILIAIALLFFFSSTAKGEETFDGNTWLRYSKQFKSIFVLGYLNGYNVGYSWGKAAGVEKTMVFFDRLDEYVKAVDANFKESKECKESFEKKKHIVQPLIAVMTLSFIKANRDNFDRLDSPDYYVNEVDAFLQTFPLCKRLNMYDLLSQLALVWLKEGKLSYKDIGTGCLELKK